MHCFSNFQLVVVKFTLCNFSTFFVVLKTGLEVDPSIIERLTSISQRLRTVEAKNDEISQRLIEAYIHNDRKDNGTKVGKTPFTNNTQLTVPSIYNYMSHLLGSKNSLVPKFELSSGRHGGMSLMLTCYIYIYSQALLLRKISESPSGDRTRDHLVSRQARYQCATENSVSTRRKVFYRDLVRVMILCLLRT